MGCPPRGRGYIPVGQAKQKEARRLYCCLHDAPLMKTLSQRFVGNVAAVNLPIAVSSINGDPR